VADLPPHEAESERLRAMLSLREQELADARRAAAYWERQSVYGAAAVAASLSNQVLLARSLARTVEHALHGVFLPERNRLEDLLAAFWRATGDEEPGTGSPR
jgi:hypothetical protein